MKYKDYNIVLLSNIILEPYLNAALSKVSQFNINLNYIPFDLGFNHERDYLIEESNILVVWLNLETILPNIWNDIFLSQESIFEAKNNVKMLCCRLLANLRAAAPSVPILWFSFEDYYTRYSDAIGALLSTNQFVDEINIEISGWCNGVRVVDLKRLIAMAGIENSYNSKHKYRWNAPYSKKLIDLAANEINKQLLIDNGISPKCLVLDCDNVLWGGILSEDGIEHIKISEIGRGRRYKDFQRILYYLYCHGIILAIASKNNLNDVLEVFRFHSEMIIKEDHISCFRVNWKSKSKSLVEISEILNIGLESIVFIDDSVNEIAEINTILPNVQTILFDPEKFEDVLSVFSLPDSFDIDVIKQRHSTYRSNVLRAELARQSKSWDTYLSSLETTITIHKAVSSELGRISELSQRTNKFTNGVRYTVSELIFRFQSKKTHIYSVYVKDRFSDLGLVGAIIVEKNELQLFTLSCRAFGRNVEDEMAKHIRQLHNIRTIQFFSTHKNEQVHKWLLSAFLNSNVE